MGLWTKLFGGANAAEKRRLMGAYRHFRALNKITAATNDAAGSWPGIPTSHGDDSLNRTYLQDLPKVQSRAQDIDVNNPDIHGFHRTRIAQMIGAGVVFKLTPHSSEIDLDPDEVLAISQKVNRIRAIHSRLGGFDAAGLRRSEGKQQERAWLTTLVLGSCLIHRVWRTDGHYPIPLSIELIAGSRISTPHNRMGDKKISYGVEYTDEHRTRVVGWHIRRVSKTIGNSFVPDFEWDFIPVEDGSLLSLTEIAGIDRALPLSTSSLRMLRHRGEFLESTVQSARAQAKHYGVTECAEGADPWEVAGDDADQTDNTGAVPVGFTNLGPGVEMLYTANGEKVTWASAKLPEPDLTGFMDVTDSRIARGLVSAKSRFTREVNSSWAGGRLEDQQDDPIIDQYRDAFLSAWQAVNEWFMDAVWLTHGLVDLPGYSAVTKAVWCEFRAQFHAKVHINPVQTMMARNMGYAMRTTTPQQGCESEGHDLRENLREWAQALQMAHEMEIEYKLKEGALDYLVAGRLNLVTMGEDPATPEGSAVTSPARRDRDPASRPEASAGQPDPDEIKANRIAALFYNRLQESDRA